MLVNNLLVQCVCVCVGGGGGGGGMIMDGLYSVMLTRNFNSGSSSLLSRKLQLQLCTFNNRVSISSDNSKFLILASLMKLVALETIVGIGKYSTRPPST